MRASDTLKMSTSSRSARARRSSSGPSNTGVEIGRRGPAIGGSIRSVSLSQVYLVELFDPGSLAPAFAQGGRVPRLARVDEPRFDLLFDDIADVDLEVGMLAREAPDLGRLVRRAFLRIRQGVACAWPGRVHRHATHDARIRVVAVAAERVERQQHIGLRGADFAHELAPKVEVFGELSVRMPQETDTLHAQHISRRRLLLLACCGQLFARNARIARALVA